MEITDNNERKVCFFFLERAKFENEMERRRQEERRIDGWRLPRGMTDERFYPRIEKHLASVRCGWIPPQPQWDPSNLQIQPLNSGDWWVGLMPPLACILYNWASNQSAHNKKLNF